MTNKFESLLDKIVDICSSGQGGGLEAWHQAELQEAISEANLTDQEKLEFFVTVLISNIFNSDGWGVSDIRLLKELLQIKQDVQITI